nr:acyltransferase family protein [uncultured Coprobacter sp.]
MSGYLCRKNNMHFDHPLMTGLLLLAVPAIAAFFIKLGGGMNTVQGWLVLIYYVIAMSGTISIMLLSKKILRYRIASIFTYIGDKTLYILVFHFLAFKLVSSIYLHFNGLPIDLLTRFPVLDETDIWMWIVYVISGIILPLAIWELTHQTLVMNKINRQNAR